MFKTVVAALACGLVSSAAAAQACNGYSQLCGKTFDNVAFPSTHNSFAYGNSAAATQSVNIDMQLQAGVRGLMLDIQYKDSTNSSKPYLCHTECTVLNAGPLVDELQKIRAFMDGNADEVVTIFIKNNGPFSAEAIAQAFAQARLDKYAYTPKAGAWPTLQTMIAQNKRLVVFVDGGSDTSVPWLAYDKDYVVQTPYLVPPYRPFGCSPMTAVRPLWIMNRFVSERLFPDKDFDFPVANEAGTVNTFPGIVEQAEICGSAGHFPNFIVVDFFYEGALFEAVAHINNVTLVSLTTSAASATAVSSAATKTTLPAVLTLT
ncbi:hypothetical protein GGI04_004965, partial [Coemansia thaxteri]